MSDIVTRIDAWQSDDKQGYDTAIGLLCEAKAEIVTLKLTCEQWNARWDTALAWQAEIATLRQERDELRQTLHGRIQGSGDKAWTGLLRRAEVAEAENARLRVPCQAFVEHYTKGGGCSHCGGLPHSASCFVGRIQAPLAPPSETDHDRPKAPPDTGGITRKGL